MSSRFLVSAGGQVESLKSEVELLCLGWVW